MQRSLFMHFIKRLMVIQILILTIGTIYSLEPASGRDKGGTVTSDTNPYYISNEVIPDSLSMFNTAAAFKHLIMNNKVALLVGNNTYTADSGFTPLLQCENDVKLVSRLFTTCCNIPEKNVTTGINLTADQFRRVFKQITGRLRSGQGFIFLYSGHGDRDGSLVFTDGERITPDELKDMINSCDNDTIMLIDACYSGNNVGPINTNPEQRFKDNCVQIYSSLAHQIAKEIDYTNRYFAPVRLFYEEVLGLGGENAITGNGYFCSFIGLFFAEYQITDLTKITIEDMFKYISNKGKEYLEQLAVTGEEVEEEYTAKSAEFEMRREQHPKMLPYDREISFRNPRHENLVMKLTRPDALTVELYTGPILNLGAVYAQKYRAPLTVPVSISSVIRLTYGPDIFKGIYLGVETGYTFMNGAQADIIMHMIPVTGIVGYRHFFTPGLLGIKADMGAGILYGYFSGLTGEHAGDDPNIVTFRFQTNTGLMVQPVRNLYLSFDAQFYGMVLPIVDDRARQWYALSYGVQFPVAVSYKF